jgi:hypothetical protein
MTASINNPGNPDQHVTPALPEAAPIPIAPPGGAIRVGDWTYGGRQSRRFAGTHRGTEIPVDIVGWQDRDGTAERHVVIDNDIFIDSVAAVCELAADLLADEMEALADSQSPCRRPFDRGSK